MMKRVVPLMAALAIVSQSGIALAQATPAEKPSAGEAAKPTKAPVTASKARYLTGEVVSVDQKAESLTVKRTVSQKSKEYTFAVEKDAVSALSDLKPGDRVRVTYTRAEGGRMMAKAIVNTSPTAKK